MACLSSLGGALALLRGMCWLVRRRAIRKPPSPPPLPPMESLSSFSNGVRRSNSTSHDRWSRFRARMSSERRLRISSAMLASMADCEDGSTLQLMRTMSECGESVTEAPHTTAEHVSKAVEARAWVRSAMSGDAESAPIVSLSHWVRYHDFVDCMIVGRTDLWHMFAYRRLLALPKVPRCLIACTELRSDAQR